MMKKSILFILAGCFALLFSSVSAQVTPLKSQYGFVEDTITNTTVKRMTYKNGANVIQAFQGYARLTAIQIDAVEISGTTAGTAQVQGSLDGLTWYNIGSAYTLTDTASQTTVIKITDGDGLYLSVLFTPTGTMSDKVKVKVLRRA